MKKTLTLIGALALLVTLFMAFGASSVFAEPSWGSSGAPASCLTCHKGDPGTWDEAVDMYAVAHDSSVGQCMTCHEYEGESIHGTWGETPESCARCHRTHSAVEDDLLAMGKDELCEFCHGNAAGLAQTNVLGGFLRLDLKSLKGGGFDTATMNTSTNTGDWSQHEWEFPVSSGTSGNVTSKHTLGVEATIWGAWNAEGFGNVTPNAGDTNTTLRCVSCHDPHAYNMTYRMLQRRPADSGVSKHPGNESDPWEQRVFVTDQLTYAEWNPFSDILSYTTEDYSDLEIGNKTWDGNTSSWVVTKIPGTTYAAPDVLDGNGTPITVGVPYSQQMSEWCASCHDRYMAKKAGYSTPGSTDSGDLIFAYRHKTGDEASSCSVAYGCHNNRNLNCLECHVAHGTIADMTPYVDAMPWPGEGGGHYDTLPDGGNGSPLSLGEGWLLEDTRPEFTGGTDHDGDSRSNLLRIDNRGVCQNPACHPKGTSSYLDPY